jgi:hypothetical protein
MTDPTAPGYGRFRPAAGCQHRAASSFPLPNGEIGCDDCGHVGYRRDGQKAVYQKPFDFPKRGFIRLPIGVIETSG